MDYLIHGQFILISIICTFSSLVLLIENVYKINILMKKLESEKSDKQRWIDKITKYCVGTPIKLYATQILIPLLITPIILFLIGAETVVVFKISLVFILFMSLSATMTYVFSQSEFKKILIGIYENNPTCVNNIINFNPKIRMKLKILLELMPLIIIALLFTSLLAYTLNSRTTGDIYYKIYNEELNDEFKNKKYNNLSEITYDLQSFNKNNNDIERFIISKNGSYTTLNNSELSEFFIKYSLANQEINRAYDYYCIDREGTYVKINTYDGNEYLVGVMYTTSSSNFLIALLISFIFLLILIFITLLYIATSLTKDIKIIIKGLNTIIKKKDLNHELIVTANDETGELTDSFNQIQKLTQKNIKEINEKQVIITNQEKLATIGRIAGDMAHAINTPNATINYNIDYLKDELSSKQPELIETLDVMKRSSDFIKKLVNSIRDQIRNLKNTDKVYFNLKETIENVGTIIGLEIKKSNCNLILDIDKEIYIYGEKNKFEQVVMNLINNAIQAYEDNMKKGTISVIGKKVGEKIIIEIIDEAGGIPKRLQDLIFKDTVTTKGSRGTGIGLIIVHSIIVGDFGGEVSFITEEGKGTKFTINLNNERMN